MILKNEKPSFELNLLAKDNCIW